MLVAVLFQGKRKRCQSLAGLVYVGNIIRNIAWFISQSIKKCITFQCCKEAALLHLTDEHEGALFPGLYPSPCPLYSA